MPETNRAAPPPARARPRPSPVAGGVRSAQWLAETALHVHAFPGEIASALDVDIEQVRGIWGDVNWSTRWGNLSDSWLHAIVRLARPKVLVETGVHYGWSSASILRALERNGEGRLYSIDFPVTAREGMVNSDGVRDTTHVDSVQDTGREVPAYLRPRWELTLGDARELLPGLLDRLGTIDLFFHDSDHSYAQQSFEYRTAWPHIRPGGLLVSDDINWSRAFREFARSVDCRPHFFRFGPGGIIRKPK